MQNKTNIIQKRHSNLSNSFNDNILKFKEKHIENMDTYSTNKNFIENKTNNLSDSKEILSSLDIDKVVSNIENIKGNEKSLEINMNDNKLNNAKKINYLNAQSLKALKINDCSENINNDNKMQKELNYKNKHLIKNESSKSFSNCSSTKSPVIIEFSKEDIDISNCGSSSDLSISSQHRNRISKQESKTSIKSNSPVVFTNNEEDTLLELSINSLELLGSYLKNSSNEAITCGIPNSTYEEKIYNKNITENFGYYNKKASSIILPYLKLNEFIEDQEISETIASISKGWPVEKSGFVLRKMIYSNGVYKNVTSCQDKKSKSEVLTSLSNNENELRNSNQSKRKGKHKKNQSNDNYRHSNDYINALFNNNSELSETKNSKEWDWVLYYVELRGQYLFFYRLYNNDTCSVKKDIHNKSKTKPGTLENIRNVFVERIISFGRNKKNSNHNHSSFNNINLNINENNCNNNYNCNYNSNDNNRSSISSTNSRNSINESNNYNSKINNDISSNNIYGKHQRTLSDKILSGRNNIIFPTTEQKSSPVLINNQDKPTLQQQLLASQNINHRDNENKINSSISRSFTFANITTNFQYQHNNNKNSFDSNGSVNSQNFEMIASSPSLNSGLPPHPLYSNSFSNFQCKNNNSNIGSSSFSSPYPSPLNTNYSSVNNNNSNQLTPNSFNSSSDIDYAPLIVPTVNINNNSKNDNNNDNNTKIIIDSQINENNKHRINSSLSIRKNAYYVNETEDIKDRLSENDYIIPPQVSIDEDISKSDFSYENNAQIDNGETSLSSEIYNTKNTIYNQEKIGNNKFSKASTIQTTLTTVSTFKSISTLSFSNSNTFLIDKESEPEILESVDECNKSNLKLLNEKELSKDLYLDNSKNKNLNKSLTVNNTSYNGELSSTVKLLPKNNYNSVQSQELNDSSNKCYDKNSPQLCDVKENNYKTSLPPPTPQNPQNSSSSNNGINKEIHNSHSRHSSIHKQKNHYGKILGKPITALNDVNNTLDILKAQKVLVHYIPLNYSVVEQLSYTIKSKGINGIITNEIPLLLLTYVNQDKAFSSACQVLLQITNIGFGTVNTPTVTPMISPSTPSSLKTPKLETLNNDAYYISSPLVRQRVLTNQNSPILTSSQIPSNFSISSSQNCNKTGLLESVDRESQFIEKEISEWSRYIQQSSSVLENPSINYSLMGYSHLLNGEVSPQILWNEERQNIDYNNYVPKSFIYDCATNTTMKSNNSSNNIRNSDILNNALLPSSIHSLSSINTFNTNSNLKSNINKEIDNTILNRSFYSDIAPTFNEGNNNSFVLDSFNKNNNQNITYDISIKSKEEQVNLKEPQGIDIKKFSKYNEMNPSFISHSLPYNYDSLEVVKSSQFISSPSTRSLDDDRIGLLSADDINNSEKHSNQYPLVTDISEIKSNECLKIPFHHELSSSSSLTTLISQDSSKSQHSILNDVSEKSIGKEGLCNEHEIQLFEVEKSKNKELEEESTSIIIPETPSMICGEVSKMQFTNIVNKNDNSSNNNNNIKIIGFNGSKFKNNLTTYNGNGNAYMNIISKNNNENNNTLVPPQKPQKSIKRIKENELRAAAQNVCNTSSDNLNIDVNSIIPARKTSLGTPFIKNKRNQLKVKISNENDGSPLKTYENIPSPVPSNSSLENECYKSNRSISNEIGNINSNSNLLVPNKIQKQLLLKPKAISGNEHKNYPRRESLKQQHPVIKTLDKNQSSPIIIQGPLSAPPYLDVYNNGLKDDYKMESIIKDIGKKKNPLSKIKEKVHEKPQKPNKENVFEIKPFPRRSSLKDNSILEEINKKKEKETEELSKKLSKELEKKQLKEKEAQKKKSKKEAKREKKEKRSEEKLDKYNINKLKISSPQLISTDELNTDNSTISVKKEKSKKGWYQLALSKLPTSKSSNSQNKKNNLFSDFKKGDTSSEILIKRTPTCSSHTSVRRRVINSNRASVCTTGTTNTISTQTSIPYGSQFDVLPEVPAILKKCISLIEECGLETEGLYRISGNSSNVQNLLKLFRLEPDKIQLLPPGNEPLKSSSRKTFKSSSNIPPPSSSLYKDSKYLYDNDIHVVTGCIKSWLRNGIPPKNEPLWPYNMYDDLIKASQIKDYTNRMIAFQDLVHALPPMNFTSLNFLFEHLFKVSTYSEQNKMTISNLAIIFGPTLLKSPPDSNENELMIITRMPFQCKAVEVLIEQYEWLFGPIEYEEESIDEDLDMNLINSSFNEIQNHIQKEIKNNEVVILKNKSNDNIDLVVNNSDKINNKIYSKLEINEKDLMGSLVEKIEKNDHNKISEKSSSQSNSKYNSNEEKKNEMEEQSESTECDNCFSQKEKNYYAVNKSDCESFISNDSQEEEYETLPRCINSSDFELSSFEQGIEKDIKNYSEIKVIPNSKNQKYSHSMNIETIKKMKKTSSEELLEFIEDDDKSDKNFKGEKKKDKERIKIKNSNSSNRLKQLLNRQNKSKKMENDSFLSNNDFKNLISSPNSVKKNNILNSLEKEKKTYEKINKNSNLLISNKNSKQDDFDEEINLCIPSNNVYKILNGNKNSQMSSEPNIYENDFSEKTLISHGNNNFDINQYNEKKKGKELTQKISISSMRIFQEQFLMDGFENDIESSLNDFLSKKFEFDDENGTLDDDKDENMLRKSSIIRLSTQMTAKWNLELEKHLEQIYRDKKRSKLFINDDLDNIEEKIKNININQNSISKTNH